MYTRKGDDNRMFIPAERYDIPRIPRMSEVVERMIIKALEEGNKKHVKSLTRKLGAYKMMEEIVDKYPSMGNLAMNSLATFSRLQDENVKARIVSRINDSVKNNINPLNKQPLSGHGITNKMIKQMIIEEQNRQV